MSTNAAAIDRLAKRWDLVLVASFAITTLLPQLDHLMRTDAARDCATENRRPAGRPAAPRSLAEARTWFARYQEFWNDTFGARDALLRAHSLLKLECFHVAPTPEFVLGDAPPWLFNAGHRELDNFRGLFPMTESELEEWRRSIEAHRDAARGVGATYAFVLAPEKHEIYPERLGANYDRLGPTRREQLVTWMRARSDVRIVDLTAAIRAQKNADRDGDFVYFESGTHWQGRGAWAGAREIERTLASDLPSLDGSSASRLEIVAMPHLRAESDLDRLYVGDLWPRGIRRVLQLREPHSLRATRIATNPVQYEISRIGGAGPKAVIFHDSFGEALQHWCAAAFSSTRMLWTPAFDETIVARDRPDVVLEIFVERVLLTNRPARVAAHEDPALEVAFRSQGRPVFALDLSRDPPAIDSESGGSLRLVAADRARALELVTTRPSNSFRLPAFDARSNDAWWVAIVEVDSEIASNVEISISRSGTGYLPAHTVSAPLEPGSNRRFLAIDPRGIDDRLILRFGPATGTFVLRRFEIREVTLPR